jgi:predicted MFS family arabinose efflux permease
VPVVLLMAITMRGREEVVPALPADAPSAPVSAGIPWALTLFAALCGAIVTAFAMYLPYHLAGIGHGSPETIAILMVVGAGMAGIPALAFGWIRARFTAIQTFLFCFLAIAASVVIVVVARELPVLVVGMALQGFGMGALLPNLFSASAGTTSPDGRARMLGFIRAGIYAGPLLAQPGLEAVMAWSGASAALLAIAAVSALGGIISVVFRGMFAPAGESLPA